jgi:hypothetical protein
MPVQYTRGFRSRLHRSDHFTAHGARLGLTAEEEYEALADSILVQSILPCERATNLDYYLEEEAKS